MIEYITSNSQDLVALLFGILGVFSIIAKLTPTDSDNKILEKIQKLVHTVGLTKK